MSTSNVPGPPAACRLAGRSISDAAFLVPPPGTVSVMVSLFTYDGKVRAAAAASQRRPRG